MSEPVPQRAVIVVPTTAEYDSRTYRLASALAARGHTVTVVARLRPGLPALERHGAGYDIVRIPVSAIDGLPTVHFWARIRDDVRRRLHRRAAPTRVVTDGQTQRPDPALPPPSARPNAPARGPVDEDEEDDGDDELLGDLPQGVLATALPRPVSIPARFAIGTVRRIVRTIVRRLSIPLTIRANVLAARQAAPVADLYHGMAYMGIPVALELGAAHGAPVVYDARDIYVDAANLAKRSRLVRLMVGRWERGWARRAARVFTVNKPYAQVMARRWGVREPLIVLNCSFRPPAPPERRRRFHEALGLPPTERIVVYQGGFSHDRGIEQLIEAIADVPGATLVLLGYGRMQQQLEELAADPATGGKLAVLPAVPPTELLDWIASADVAAMPIQPTTLNHRLTTPNKLFEAMAAGVPVVASDLPGMAAIVRDAGCGVLVDPTDPGTIAGAIRQILELPPDAYEAWRARCAAAAMESYNWERQMELVLEEYGRLTGRPW